MLKQSLAGGCSFFFFALYLNFFQQSFNKQNIIKILQNTFEYAENS